MIRSLSALFFMAGSIISCSPRVINFTNDNASFASYQSFVVLNFKVSTEDLSREGQQILTSIEDLIASEMIRRDYTQSSKDPDLVVRYELISNQRIETDRAINPYYYPGSLYPGQYVRIRAVLESALLLEISDTDTRKLVWQASVDLNKYARKKSSEEILQNAVTQLFNTYLYRAGAKSPDSSLIVE